MSALFLVFVVLLPPLAESFSEYYGELQLNIPISSTAFEGSIPVEHSMFLYLRGKIAGISCQSACQTFSLSV